MLNTEQAHRAVLRTLVWRRAHPLMVAVFPRGDTHGGAVLWARDEQAHTFFVSFVRVTIEGICKFEDSEPITSLSKALDCACTLAKHQQKGAQMLATSDRKALVIEEEQ